MKKENLPKELRKVKEIITVTPEGTRKKEKVK